VTTETRAGEYLAAVNRITAARDRRVLALQRRIDEINAHCQRLLGAFSAAYRNDTFVQELPAVPTPEPTGPNGLRDTIQDMLTAAAAAAPTEPLSDVIDLLQAYDPAAAPPWRDLDDDADDGLVRSLTDARYNRAIDLAAALPEEFFPAILGIIRAVNLWRTWVDTADALTESGERRLVDAAQSITAELHCGTA